MAEVSVAVFCFLLWLMWGVSGETVVASGGLYILGLFVGRLVGRLVWWSV